MISAIDKCCLRKMQGKRSCDCWKIVGTSRTGHYTSEAILVNVFYRNHCITDVPWACLFQHHLYQHRLSWVTGVDQWNHRRPAFMVKIDRPTTKATYHSTIKCWRTTCKQLHHPKSSPWLWCTCTDTIIPIGSQLLTSHHSAQRLTKAWEYGGF